MSVETQLQEARSAGDRDRMAQLLVRSANELASAGRIDDARRRLDEAAKLHKEARRHVDEARCLGFAATLCRAAGKLDLAESRATRAEKIAPDATAPKVSAATELGEINLARQSFSAAADCYRRALQHGLAAGLIAAAQAVLLRKRGQALAQAGDLRGAASELERAAERYRAGNEEREARKTEVELLTALRELDEDDRADALDARVLADATAAGDAWVLADLALLQTSRSLDDGDTDAARTHARDARQHALDGTHPVAYVTSALVLAELAEAAGDRVAAYEALAVGWATLGDLLGDEAAKATFEPKLQEQRQRWGDEAFAEARDRYYAAREAASKS